MVTPADAIPIVDAAYEMEASDTQWLLGISEAVRAWLAPEAGLFSFVAETSNPNALRTWLPTYTSLARSESLPAVPQELTSLGRDVAERCLRFISCSTFSEAGIQNPTRYPDLLLLTANDLSEIGVVFAAPMLAPGAPSPRVRRTWARIATHICAAHRVRRELARLRDEVFSEQGTRTSTARQLLSVLCADATQQPSPFADEGARARRTFAELLKGRCSLLDQFDRDGRHYLVLRRNAPHTPDPRALTEREVQIIHYAAEGHTDRWIGARLGVRNSTVATHRTRAMLKLGIRSRAILSQLVRQTDSQANAKNRTLRAQPGGGIAVNALRVGSEDLAVLSFPCLSQQLPTALTNAERRVAVLLLEGLSNGEIAKVRGTSTRTVANQAAAVFRKIGVRRRAQLAERLLDAARQSLPSNQQQPAFQNTQQMRVRLRDLRIIGSEPGDSAAANSTESAVAAAIGARL